MKNKYAKRSRISEAKVRQIVKLFAVDLNALQIAEIAGVNRNTANRYLAAFRERIARFCEAESPVQGEVEVDESYFGARRVKGVRGLGAKENHCIRYSSVTVAFIPKLSRTVQKSPSKGSSGAA